MEGKKLLIVGIDPGVTTAYAVLDIEGNLIHINSSKELDLNHLISQTIAFGKVVLVGTDKVKVPRLVEAFATKFGARIVSPNEDIKVDEKRKLVQNFSFHDEHQLDALASALFAYKETKILLDKIDVFVKKNKKDVLLNKIKELVIIKKMSIKNATSIMEKKDEEDKIIEKVIVEKKLNENDFLRLYNKLRKYESEIKIMNIYNNRLKNRIKDLEKIEVKKEENKNAEKKQDFRENRIRFLENLLKLKDREKHETILLIKKFNMIMSDMANFHILKKLGTLGMNEFTFKNRILNIQRNDVLLIDNPNIVSNAVIELLKDKVFVIIYKKSISKKMENTMPFVFINAKNLKIEEDKYFGFVEKRHFEIEKSKIDWAKKIIDDYKREKEQLI